MGALWRYMKEMREIKKAYKDDPEMMAQAKKEAQAEYDFHSEIESERARELKAELRHQNEESLERSYWRSIR